MSTKKISLTAAVRAITVDWSKTNERRCELINKKAARKITKPELHELDRLQAYCSARQNLISPLPNESLEYDLIEVLKGLLKKSEAQNKELEARIKVLESRPLG